MFGGKGDSDRGGGNALGVVLRIVFEALYWTFHPFSPIARRNVWDGSVYDERRIHRGRGQRSRQVRRFGQLVTIQEDDDVVEEEVPFYEKVNRFVFGPEAEPPMPIEVQKKRLVAQIRAKQGRIGLLDVMRVTGLPREEADPLIARLLLDFDGEVDVDDNGAITYRFEKLRKTAGDTAATAPPPAWDHHKVAPKVTGNTLGANFLVGAVNAFNVVMATVAISLNMTVERLMHLFQNMNSLIPVEPLPYGGVPVVLGVIPLIFSLVLFALPALRALRKGAKEKAVAEENARAQVLKTVFQTMTDAATKGEAVTGVREDRLKQAWQQATGKAPDDKELIEAVVALGGDVDMDAMASGTGLYRFRDLEAEVKALQAERTVASAAEEAVGEVVYRAE
jgi:hypothetical protein